MADGEITGTVKIDGAGVERALIGISYEPQLIGDEETPRRIVVGETTSASDGTYTLETPGFVDEVIVLALDNYGEMWRPNRAYTVGQRIRPTRGNETGYGYDITIAGDSGTEEPTWWTPAGGSDTGSIGAATAVAAPLWWSVAQAPILPTASEVIPTDDFWSYVRTWADFSDGLANSAEFSAINFTAIGTPLIEENPSVEGDFYYKVDRITGTSIPNRIEANYNLNADFTVEFEFEVNTVSESFTLIDTRSGDVDSLGIVFYVRSTGKLTFAEGNGGFTAHEGTDTVPAATNLTAALVRKGNKFIWFLDGEYQGEHTESLNLTRTLARICHSRSTAFPQQSGGKLRFFRFSQYARYEESYTVPETYPTQGA